jgi:hypothetical protein
MEQNDDKENNEPNDPLDHYTQEYLDQLRPVVEGRKSIRQLVEDTGGRLKRSTIGDHVKLLKQNKTPKKRGRPSILSPKDRESFVRLIRTRDAQNNSVSTEEMPSLLRDFAQKKRRESGRAGVMSPPSKKTTRRLCFAMGLLAPKKAQRKTVVRFNAETDPRNGVSLWVAANAVLHDQTTGASVSPRLHLNFDSTTFLWGGNKGLRVWRAPGNEAAVSTGGLVMNRSCKLLTLQQAYGGLAPPVICLKVKSMDKGDLIPLRVPGLSPNREALSFGWIWLTQSGSLDGPGFMHYFRDVVFPYIEQCREGLQVSRDFEEGHRRIPGDDRVVIWLDGESAQISGIEHPAMMDELKHKGIDVVKLASNTSGKTQPADLSVGFMCLKALLKSKRFKPLADKDLERAVDKALAQSRAKLTRATRQEYAALTGQLPTILSAAFRPISIQRGFQASGLHPLSKEQVWTQCPGFAQLTNVEEDDINEALPGLIDLFATTGRVTEQDFTDFNIFKADYQVEAEEAGDDRDGFTDNRQRVLFTAETLSIKKRKRSSSAERKRPRSARRRRQRQKTRSVERPSLRHANLHARRTMPSSSSI